MPVVGAGLAALMAGRLGVRNDPYFGYNFLVEIQGILAGGFSEVSGLSIKTEVHTFREGGLNTTEHKIPGPTTFENIVLRKGVSDIDMLWGWYQDVLHGKVKRRNGTIYLLSHANTPARWWDLVGAYPIAWEGPSLNASSSQVAVQAITLAHEGLVSDRKF